MPKINAKKICLIRTSALGDMVHAIALVNGLRKGYPDAHLTWVLQNLPYDMVKHQTNVDRFITFDRKGSLKSWFLLFKQLRQETYDLVLVPQMSAKVSLITIFTRAKIKLGFDFKRSRDFHWVVTNYKIPFRPRQHVQDQFFEFLDFLGIKDYPVEWNFKFTDRELAWKRSFFERIEKPVIGFVIASSNRDKDWGLEKYANVIDYVGQELDMQPLLIGGPSEIERKNAARICRMCKKNPVIALEKPIRKTMMQLAGSRIVISPDTGPLHMAVALNTPTIGLYGYSNPRRCGPYRKYHDLLIDKYNEPGEENTPITHKTKPGRMQLITSDEVIEKIELGLETYSS